MQWGMCHGHHAWQADWCPSLYFMGRGEASSGIERIEVADDIINKYKQACNEIGSHGKTTIPPKRIFSLFIFYKNMSINLDFFFKKNCI